MNIRKIMKVTVTGLLMVTLLAACNLAEKSGDAKAEGNDHVRTVKVAYVQSSKPTTYTDEQGNATGYDVEILRAVEKHLPQYKFEFVGTSDDDLLVGVEQGKYQVGVKNAFWTEERTAKFIYPKAFIGLSSIGLVLKEENSEIKTLEDFASADLSLAPIAANNAQYTVISEHNEAHPNNKVKLQAGDTFSIDVVQWVNEGRVDGAVIIEASYDKQVTSEDGPYHHLKDDVVYNEFAVIKTWPLFNKKEQEFADAFDQAMEKVMAEKIPNEKSEAFYGKDLFKVLDKVER